MTIADALLPEFDREMGLTRRVLERVPDEHFAWKPHARSWSLGQLASHVAQLPHWMEVVLGQDELNLQGLPPSYTPPATGAELLRRFEETTAAARAMLAGTDDAALTQPWTLRMGDHVIMQMSRAATIRTVVINHLVHHRAQLGVYLRLLDIPVPYMYGPSADEPNM